MLVLLPLPGTVIRLNDVHGVRSASIAALERMRLLASQSAGASAQPEPGVTSNLKTRARSLLQQFEGKRDSRPSRARVGLGTGSPPDPYTATAAPAPAGTPSSWRALDTGHGHGHQYYIGTTSKFPSVLQASQFSLCPDGRVSTCNGTRRVFPSSF